MVWSELEDWWVDELQTDAAYEEVVTPLLLRMLQPRTGELYLDVGSGEGRVMRAVAERGALAHGLDINPQLALRSMDWGPAMVGELPSLGFVKDESYDGAYAVLVLEHVEDHGAFFGELSRVVRAGGTLALVSNHPVWTAPDSTPITDFDGEVLWRPGGYFSSGTTEEPAGTRTVTFYHRTMASLLTSAAGAGWSLQQLVEKPHHEHEAQSGIPRLLACRWRLLP